MELGLAWEEANGTYNVAHARFALGDELTSTQDVAAAKAKFAGAGRRAHARPDRVGGDDVASAAGSARGRP